MLELYTILCNIHNQSVTFVNMNQSITSLNMNKLEFMCHSVKLMFVSSNAYYRLILSVYQDHWETQTQ